jgi:adenylate cyclase
MALRLVDDIRRRLVLLGWLSSVAGSFVVFVAIGFFIPIFIDADDRIPLGLMNAPLAAAYLAIAGVVTTRLLDRHRRDALAWVAEGRPGTEREHLLTLGLAWFGVKIAALAWLIAGVLFFALNAAAHSLAFGAVALATIWLGGETTCAILYLASERVLRPVTACALAERPPPAPVGPGVRARLAWAWALGTGVPLLGVLVVGTVGVARADVETEYVAGAVIFLGAVAWIAGLLATMFAAKAISDPLTAVRRGLEQVQRGSLDVHVTVDDSSEVGLLQAGFNRMAAGLREREHLRDLLGRQVGEDVARAALREGVRLGGEEREVGALFVDVIGSTSLALAMSPTDVVRVLNRFFGVVVDVVEAQGGLVNKFEGDAALCVFGAPVARAAPAGDALHAARALADRLSREVREVDFGIGVSAGVAVAGNIGAESRFEYTVIGDPVNEAARLCDLAKQRPERVLASERALDVAGEAERAAWSVTDSALLRGRDAPTSIAHPREPSGAVG